MAKKQEKQIQDLTALLGTLQGQRFTNRTQQKPEDPDLNRKIELHQRKLDRLRRRELTRA